MRARPIPHPLALVLCAGAAAGLSPLAHASPLSWNNAAGGTASIAANWNPVQAPTGADDLTFNLAGSYTVTFNASAASSRTQTYKQGTVTLNATSPHTVSNGITIGDLSGDNATMTVTTGTLNSTASVFVGDASGSAGVLNVNDDDADLIITGAAADLVVGNNGNGTLNITNVGRVVVPDQFIAGSNSTSTVSVLVSGFLAVAPFGRSTLGVSGTSTSRIGAVSDESRSITSGVLARCDGEV